MTCLDCSMTKIQPEMGLERAGRIIHHVQWQHPHAITAKNQRHNPGRREPMDAEALRQSLEAILASNEEPPPSIREVALRLGYRSESTLYYHFPELTHKIVAK